MNDGPRPPRLYIPIGVRRQAGRAQGGVCLCGCGTPCWADEKETKALVEWDHFPALILRMVNDEGTDYVPPQLDPAYIVGRCRPSHKPKTKKDVGAKAKINRILGLTKAKPKRQWGKRPLCSRNTFQKGAHKWPKQKMRSRKMPSRRSSPG